MRRTLVSTLFASASVLGLAGAAAAETANVPAAMETEPVPNGDASLVAIWLNATDPAESRILGTDEDGAFVVFGIDGVIRQVFESEKPVGVDVRYDIDVDGAPTDIAVVGDDDTGMMQFYAISPSGELSALGDPVEASVHASIPCLYESSLTGLLNAFVLDGEGRVGQYAVTFGPEPTLDELRVFEVGGETSICLADDTEGTVYIGEESTGLWSYAAEPEASRARVLVDAVLPVDPTLTEIEGLAMVAAVTGQGGYLFAADENAQAIVVYDRATYAHLGSVEIGEGTVDAVDDPHGVAVMAMPLGEAFPAGVLVSQDDDEDGEKLTFKLVSLADIVAALGLEPVEPRDPRTPIAVAAAVLPIAETEPVGSRGDAADDPAIWVNPEDPEASLIVGTDKQSGLGVYDLDGELLSFVELGQINNVDLRTVDGRVIVAATNRVNQTIEVLELSPDGELISINAAPIPVEGGEAYGFCLYQDVAGDVFGIPNTTAGVVSMIPFAFDADGKVTGETVASWQLETQPEGCVVDDAAAELFVGEEGHGIWMFDLNASDPSVGTLVFEASDAGPLVPDVEGLALWTHDGHDYLVASSQGSDRYVILDRADWSFAGAFRIVADRAEGIDGATETDGLEITSIALDDDDFEYGIMVAQDGLNEDEPQNFKIITMLSVIEALGWDD